MALQTFDVKKHIKLIKKALKSDFLYSTEEIHKLKMDLRNLEKTQELVRQHQSNGFGQYVRQPVVVESTIAPVVEPEVVESVEVEVMESADV
jgi:hypothetical protein